MGIGLVGLSWVRLDWINFDGFDRLVPVKLALTVLDLDGFDY
jgi:hypothetical protein